MPSLNHTSEFLATYFWRSNQDSKMLREAQKSRGSTKTQFACDCAKFDRIDIFELLFTVLNGFTNEIVGMWIVQLHMRQHYGIVIILTLITILSIVTMAVVMPFITIAVAGITIFRKVVVVSASTQDFSYCRLNWESGGGKNLKIPHKCSDNADRISNHVDKLTPLWKDYV